MSAKDENIGMCKKCGNCDYLNEEDLCTKCSKHEPELKCCGEGLEFHSNKLFQGIRTLVADCIVCGNHYTIKFKERKK